MMVWFPDNEASAKPAPYPTIATTAKVTTSGRKNPATINDAEEPSSSSDPSSYFDWWPKKGSTEWVEYAFDKPAQVSECQVYWFDDSGHGEVRVPASWRLLYKSGDEWKPVAAREPYGTERGRYNRGALQPGNSRGMRLEDAMHANLAGGVPGREGQ